MSGWVAARSLAAASLIGTDSLLAAAAGLKKLLG